MNIPFIKFVAKKSGYTLVEVLVTVVVFAILLGAIIGIWASAIRMQRYILNSQELLNQTSYIMEYTSRAIRMAKKDVTDICAIGTNNYGLPVSGDDGVRFRNMSGICKEFFKNGDVLKDGDEGRPLLSPPFPRDLDLTSSLLIVNDFNVLIQGDFPNNQPRVTLFLDIEAGSFDPKPRIKIQTTVSQRDLNI